MSLIEEWVLLAAFHERLQSKRTMRQKIIPSLWFDNQAAEAFQHYTKLLPYSQLQVTNPTVVEAELMGLAFIGLNGGPLYKPNPSLSFSVYLPDPTIIRNVWNELLTGGAILMPLQSYPFNEFYGWLEDCYGFSWQLLQAEPDRVHAQDVLPSLMFCGDRQGQCSQALEFYQEVFSDFHSHNQVHYPDGPTVGQVMYTQFSIRDTLLTAMDSGTDQDFSFNPAVSLTIPCQDQQEIDYFWEKLTDGGQESNCGWCQDRFGVSWQIVPEKMARLMARPGAREALQEMKKIDLQRLRGA